MLNRYREDEDKQQNGSPWYSGDTTILCRRSGTPEAKRVMKELRDQLFGPLHKWTAQDDSVLLAHFLVEYGVCGWENVRETEKGEPIPYSKNNARMIFLNPEYYLSMNVELFAFMSNFENYLFDAAEEDIEALKKN